jgi:hypothetical protein
MVYRYFVGAPIGEQECRSRAITWCTGCRNNGWDSTQGVTANTDLYNCAVGTPNNPGYFPDLPDNCGGADDWCAAFIPIG